MGGRRRHRVTAGALAGLLVLVSVAPEAGARPELVASARATRAAAAPAQAPPSRAEWTMLVYLDADNNLEGTGLLDLQEMAEAAGPNLNLLVLIDRNTKDQAAEPVIPDGDVLGIPSFSDAKVLKLSADGAEVVEELGEIDLMDPQNLSWFVWYGLTEYPAERTGLVLWDHGGAAILPFGEDADSSPGEFLSLPELQQAIGSATSAAGADRLDLIGFDACLNATVEVARAMAPYGEVMVASQEIEAGHGWDWTTLSVLQEQGVSGKELAAAFVDSYAAHSSEPPLGGESDYTLSAIDLDALDGVDQALAGFVTEVERDPANGLALLQARQGAMEFGVVGADPEGNFQQVDLGDLLARLPDSLPDAVLVARNSLRAAIDRAVFASVAGPAHAGASGLAIQLPSSGAAYSSLYEDHVDATGWRELVKSILEGASTPPGTDSPDAIGDLELLAETDGWRATMRLADGAGSTLAGAAGIFGSPGDDGTALALTLVPATLGAGGVDDVQGAWGYQFVRIAGQPVTAQVEPLQEGFRASIGGVFLDPSGSQSEATLQMDLIIEGGAFRTENVSLLESAGGGVATIYPPDGSRFAPSRLTVSGADIVETEYLDPIDTAQFEVSIDELPSGTRFYASLLAFLPDGSAAVRSAVATRP